jgi:hypothetical protein
LPTPCLTEQSVFTLFTIGIPDNYAVTNRSQ